MSKVYKYELEQHDVSRRRRNVFVCGFAAGVVTTLIILTVLVYTFGLDGLGAR